MSMQSKATTDRHQRILLELLKQPGNEVCADCRARNPRWASWSLGIFLCVQCAGIHRKMGVHVSKVKSVTLDSWTREQLDRMKAVGNIKSNAQYNPDERKHPPPTDFEESERGSQLERYVRQKYERKAFMDALPALPPVLARAIPAAATIGRPGSVASSPSTSTASVVSLSPRLVHIDLPRSDTAPPPDSPALSTTAPSPAPPPKPSLYSGSSLSPALGAHTPLSAASAPSPLAGQAQPRSVSLPIRTPEQSTNPFQRSNLNPMIHQMSNATPLTTTPAPTVRTDGVWGDLMQLSEPPLPQQPSFGNGSYNGAGLASAPMAQNFSAPIVSQSPQYVPSPALSQPGSFAASATAPTSTNPFLRPPMSQPPQQQFLSSSMPSFPQTPQYEGSACPQAPPSSFRDPYQQYQY